MKERFKVSKMHICPVYKIDNGFRLDLEYPTRYCVIDKEKQIAIDIKTKLKYDYIETVNNSYFKNESHKKIKGYNRVAIFPYVSVLDSECDKQEVLNIIQQLQNNIEFQDGNEVYNNKAYLEYIKQEIIKESKNKIKIFRKRKK